MREQHDPADSGWVGAGPDDDLEARLAAEEAGEPFDRRRPHVITLLGPIEPAALGVGLVARSIIRGPAPAATPAAGSEPFAAVAALEDFYAVGGRAVVDAAPNHPGRPDRASLPWIAARAPVHLVAGTAPPFAGPTSREEPDRASDGNAHDGGEGGNGGAGFVRLDITSLPSRREDAGREAVVEGGAAAHRASGLPILLTGGGEGAAAAVARLAAEGVDAERTIVLGPEAGWREAELMAVLAAGAFAVVETDAAGPAGQTRAGPAERIASLVRDGGGDRLLLGVGGPVTATTAVGAPAVSDLLERFPLRLMEAGLGALAVRGLLVENLARALAIPGRAGEGDGDGRG